MTKNAPAPQADRQPDNPIVKLREQFDARSGELANALPPHIPVERFLRVVMTAVQRNPDLVNADRVSLFTSSLLAAQDGLLPDGREGALVIYNTKIKGKNGQPDQWRKMVQWMPMIVGVLKKARNSGEISALDAHVVHERDKFVYRIGIDELPIFEPDWFSDRGKAVGAYAFAILKDGTKLAEVMSLSQIEEVRAVSRAANDGPWTKWWGEMARKTVLRRFAKRLPMSSDLDDLIRRDDALYDFEGQKAPERQMGRTGSVNDRLKALAAPATGPKTLDAQQDEFSDRGDASAAQGAEDNAPPSDESSAPDESTTQPSPEQLGYDAAMNGAARDACPRKLTGKAKELWLAGFDRATTDADKSGEG